MLNNTRGLNRRITQTTTTCPQKNVTVFWACCDVLKTHLCIIYIYMTKLRVLNIAVQRILLLSSFHYFLVLVHCLVAIFLSHLLLLFIFSMLFSLVQLLALPLSLVLGDHCSYFCHRRWGFFPSCSFLPWDLHLSIFHLPVY